MQYLTEWEEEGCFVYQVLSDLEVRREPSIEDSHRTGISFHAGELVSIDLVLAADNNNGPFLHLSDHKGWLFETKKGERMMKPMPVESGLWALYVDNFPTGLAPRSHPVDRSSMRITKGEFDRYQPMQKIYCDKRVEPIRRSPTGVTFYRVQGTNGWVFDKRPDEDNENFTSMLVEESKVKTGLFAYRSLSRIGIRNDTNVGDESRTGDCIDEDEIIAVDIVRDSPFKNSNNGPFLRLTDGSGWLFEQKYGEKTMQEIPIERGTWAFKVLNGPAGIALRRQPMDRQDMILDTDYAPNTLVKCDRRIASPTGVNFYRVVDTDGWIFDRRGNDKMLELLSTGAANSPLECRTPTGGGWSPDFVRGVAATVEGLVEIMFNEHSRVISFRTYDGARINVYYTTRTVGTAMDHPTQGKTQIFRRDCSASDLANIMKNPRLHTGRGYQQKRGREWLERPTVVESSLGPGILVEHEEELRNEVLEYDKEMAKLKEKRLQALKSLKTYDERRGTKAEEMKREFQKFESAREEQKRQKAEAQRLQKAQAQRRQEAEARKRRLQERTCAKCSRVFANAHALQQHVRDVHTSFECDYCDRVFKSRNALNQHCDDTDHW